MAMVTVSIKDEYAEVLTALGELQQAIDVALKRYTIEQITAKVEELRQRDAMYQAKYGLDYPTFVESIAEDEAFVRQVESQVNKMWELDMADWEFCYKGMQDWLHKLQTILLA
jgi:hypothetical protein